MLWNGRWPDKISNQLAGDVACLGGSTGEYQLRFLGSRVRVPARAFAIFSQKLQFQFLFLFSLPLPFLFPLPSTFCLRLKRTFCIYPINFKLYILSLWLTKREKLSAGSDEKTQCTLAVSSTRVIPISAQTFWPLSYKATTGNCEWPSFDLRQGIAVFFFSSHPTVSSSFFVGEKWEFELESSRPKWV